MGDDLLDYDDDDDDAYRARPVIAGVLCPAGVLHTCAEYSAAWLGPYSSVAPRTGCRDGLGRVEPT